MRRSKKEKKLRRRKSTLIIFSSLVLTVSISLLFGAFFSSANEETTSSKKYYRSIEIQSGDSLWSICKEHMPDDYSNIIDYMNEIAEINQIKLAEFDTIYEGDYLTISYFE